MKKKFELTNDSMVKYGRKFFRIRALIDIHFSWGTVKKGEYGGYIEDEKCLTQNGNAWVFENGLATKDCVIRGGVIWGGEIWGGVIRGGEIWGGVIRGGEIWGGEIRGGEIWGGAEITDKNPCISLCNVGSSNGVLTAYKNKEGDIILTRGCFTGSVKEFISAVKKKHKNNKTAKEYKIAVDFIKMRMA